MGRSIAVAVLGAFGLIAPLASPGCSSGGESTSDRDASRIVARIRVPGSPFRVAAGAGSVWVLNRGPDKGAASGDPWKSTLARIDPRMNKVVGPSVPLAVDSWDLTVGFGSLWMTQFDGSILRIDPKTGRIVARLSARPLYFGSAITTGEGFVWIANDDERNKRGSVSKIDPATNRVVGTVHGLRSPQSIAYGAGAVWAADHAGALVKIDPSSLRILARTRLNFGAHGVVATRNGVYVADAHAGRIVECDPKTAKIRRVRTLSPGAIHPALGARSIWSSSALTWEEGRDDRVIRIDPENLSIVETYKLGGSVGAVAFGYGSVWAADREGRVIRLEAD